MVVVWGESSGNLALRLPGLLAAPACLFQLAIPLGEDHRVQTVTGQSTKDPRNGNAAARVIVLLSIATPRRAGHSARATSTRSAARSKSTLRCSPAFR